MNTHTLRLLISIATKAKNTLINHDSVKTVQILKAVQDCEAMISLLKQEIMSQEMELFKKEKYEKETNELK